VTPLHRNKFIIPTPLGRLTITNVRALTSPAPSLTAEQLLNSHPICLPKREKPVIGQLGQISETTPIFK